MIVTISYTSLPDGGVYGIYNVSTHMLHTYTRTNKLINHKECFFELNLFHLLILRKSKKELCWTLVGLKCTVRQTVMSTTIYYYYESTWSKNAMCIIRQHQTGSGFSSACGQRGGCHKPNSPKSPYRWRQPTRSIPIPTGRPGYTCLSRNVLVRVLSIRNGFSLLESWRVGSRDFPGCILPADRTLTTPALYPYKYTYIPLPILLHGRIYICSCNTLWFNNRKTQLV